MQRAGLNNPLLLNCNSFLMLLKYGLLCRNLCFIDNETLNLTDRVRTSLYLHVCLLLVACIVEDTVLVLTATHCCVESTFK